MMSPLARLTLAFTLTATINLPAIADVILLRQVIQETPENSAAGLERPISGMPMSEVAVRFGQPLEKRESVGTPPITRWIYDRYTVYFEHDRVLSAVIRRRASPSTEEPQTP
nr:hypothetical protein [Gammaproteobacteria bacterium]